ncbi:MAG: DUF4184 family protein [Candidatus Geothermarchaeales archaeon]
MPATPLHFLAIAFLYFRSPERFDLVALFFSSVLLDLEPLYLVLVRAVPDHQVWHSFLFVTTVYLVAVSAGVWLLENRFEGTIARTFSFFRLDASNIKRTPAVILLSILIGGTSHVFFDMFTHEEMPYVVYPLSYGNPFWLVAWDPLVGGFVVALSLYSLWIWWRSAVRR